MRRFLILIFLWAVPFFGQSNTGELRLRVTDPAGLGVKSAVELISESNQLKHNFVTDDVGVLEAKRLPFGLYRLQVQREGFATFTQQVEIRSAVPATLNIKLAVEGLQTSVEVNAQKTLIDPYQSGSVNRVGTDTIQDRVASLPGRSLQDLVNSQPGWLYEGNAVLHPRGSEYQTQFVVDGIPLTDNRSPSFGPEIEADDVESMSVYTAGIPAEYGRKMGGVVEVETARDTRAGLHGQAVLGGGSYDTAGAYGMLQYLWGKNTLSGNVDGSMTSHYLNPPVLENYTNNGTAGDFGLSYERDLTPNDRLRFTVRHELARFLVPNEQLQQAAGQRQDRSIYETMGIVAYQHIFSPNVLGDFRGMVRNDQENLSSNDASTPIIAFQNNSFTEGYFKGSISVHTARHEWKMGVESDSTWLHENFSDIITDPSQFDPGTPTTFAFTGSRPDLEQSAYVQDLIRLGAWTISAGLRWDHYQLLMNRNAVSPRLSVARYFQSADLVVHASYDRVFQTPDFENILLSSSPMIASLNPQVLRLPVEPSQGNYYEVGLNKGFFGKVGVELNGFIRDVNNYADDDQLLDTAVSFPIAFRKSHIYGAESKINLPHWGRLSGYVSYSYIVGSAYFPVTGGLFLGSDASQALSQLGGRFWDSQDQRHSVRARYRYDITSRFWAAVGAEYGSGLPVEFDGSYQDAVEQYGQQVVARVNFDRGRVKPSLSIDTSLGAVLRKTDKTDLRLQFDATNLNDRLNVIDFAGLFSGNAIAPQRSYAVRLSARF